MPGLSFLCDLDRGSRALYSDLPRALVAAKHDSNYKDSILFADESCLIAATAYPEYPVATFDFGDVVVHLEGRVYGPQPTLPALQELTELLFEPERASIAKVTDWVRRTDGEFVAIGVQRSTGRMVILNDMLGRLPLYCQRRGGRLLVSRELGFIARLLPRIDFDRMGMAQTLLVGFPLGNRTLFEAVDRVSPGTCIRIDPRQKEIVEQCAPALDLGPEESRRRDGREEARDLASIFADACRARAVSAPGNIVSLSGGADSRAVAACLQRIGARFQCATFLDADGASSADVDVAARLAAVLGAPWHQMRLRAPTDADHLHLLRLKSGMNPLAMAYLIPYLQEVQRRFGAGVTFFTGDGGDKVLPDLRIGSASDAKSAAIEIVDTHQVFSLEEVSAITGLAVGDILGELRRRVDSYPEERWPDRCVHFEILERAFKWLFEGEDRNRAFFWSTSPFYSTPFFLAVMRCAHALKTHRALYRDFLLEIAPAVAAIEYAGVGVPIDSTAFRIAVKAASLLAKQRRRLSQEHWRIPGSSGGQTAAAVDRIRHQVARAGAMDETLRREGISDFLDSSAADRPYATSTLFTLTSLLEHFSLA